MDLEPTTPVLVESTRLDDTPTLRRARIAATSVRLVGITMEGRGIADLRLYPVSRIGISSPGRFGVVHGAVLGIDLTLDALVIEVDPVVVPLQDRRGHQRTAAPVGIRWRSGSTTAVDVSPGGVLLVGAGPTEATPVTIDVAGSPLLADALPLWSDDRFTRLRFRVVVPELDAARLVRAVTFAG